MDRDEQEQKQQRYDKKMAELEKKVTEREQLVGSGVGISKK